MKTLFLTGYGLSINVNNTRLVFKHGINDPFSKQIENIELPASACPFDKVIIYSPSEWRHNKHILNESNKSLKALLDLSRRIL